MVYQPGQDTNLRCGGLETFYGTLGESVMKLFVYGILKRNYELDLRKFGCTFLGEAELPGATLYGIGGQNHDRLSLDDFGKDSPRQWSGVGLRFTPKDPDGVAHGEVFEIPDSLWDWLDTIENNGFTYTRKVVQVQVKVGERFRDGAPVYEPVEAWVYEHTFPGMEYKNPIEGGVF